jgi:hypothetical protein
MLDTSSLLSKINYLFPIGELFHFKIVRKKKILLSVPISDMRGGGSYYTVLFAPSPLVLASLLGKNIMILFN